MSRRRKPSRVPVNLANSNIKRIKDACSSPSPHIAREARQAWEARKRYTKDVQEPLPHEQQQEAIDAAARKEVKVAKALERHQQRPTQHHERQAVNALVAYTRWLQDALVAALNEHRKRMGLPPLEKD